MIEPYQPLRKHAKMAFLMLLINTLSYRCTCMGLVVTEALMWLLQKGIFLYDDD